MSAISPSTGVAATGGPEARTPTGHVWSSVDAGGGGSCGIRLDGTLWCWGLNAYGQLGLGDIANRQLPNQVGTDKDWLQVSVGSLQTCAIRTDHTLWCWGYNGHGALGLGDTTDRHTPVQVGSDTDWARTSEGALQSCAIRTDRTLWCWGFNAQGQLGLGDTTDRDVPTQVAASIDDWTGVSVGYLHTCGLRSDHTLWCWGDNTAGDLGLGDTTERHSPAQVAVGTRWAHVGAGGYSFTCGTRLNQTLWCWGDNASGELGLGDRVARHTPTQVGGTGWIRLSTGDDHTCGIKASHTLWCWGYNYAGQLGFGDKADRLVPVQVGAATSWTGVSSGDYSQTCSPSRDHALLCWGLNAYGQLGLGDYKRRLVPRHV